MSDLLIDALELCIRRDPGGRGLLSTDATHPPLCRGQLEGAARALLAADGPVWIVTGFFVPAATPPVAETDGPPGAALLSAVLRDLGKPVRVIAEDLCGPVVEAALRAAGATDVPVWLCPLFAEGALRWQRALWDRERPGLVLAIERVGPSHTYRSFMAQSRTAPPPGVMFLEKVPAESWNRCHNMRGIGIDDHTAPLHALFEEASARGVPTIGIGDGGNEIGMGAIPWEELVERLPGAHSARIPCRIATDWTILAGVSNWGGFALAATTAHLAARPDLLKEWTTARHQQALEQLVEESGAVDGVTRLPEPTVDGLSFEAYIQPWHEMRRAMDFE